MKYVTGLRPSGSLHLGNYLGAIRQARTLNSVIFIADMHGVYSENDISATVKCLENLGIKPLLQSNFGLEHLKIYAELLHYATIGHLSRMTQYKEKSEKESQTAALLVYPVLMAADIFFLQGEGIPVGGDQVQHLEFIRDLYDKLSNPRFPKPHAIISHYPRIMSLKDASKKMSKSDPDDDSRINLTDSKHTIRSKIFAAKTSHDIEDKTPEMYNLKLIYAALGGTVTHTKFKEFKEELSELLIKELLECC